jgi:restriction endonuclease S subunit
MAVFSIIKLSELEGAKRIDAEYYKPELMFINEILKKREIIEIGKVADVVDGPFGSSLHAENYVEKGIPFLRVHNVTEEGLLNLSDLVFIREEDHERLKSSEALPGDVIITKTGWIGFATVITDDIKKCNYRADLAKIRLRTTTRLDPYFVAMFLNSKYGRLQTKRLMSGARGDRILAINIKTIVIPYLNNKIQKEIRYIYSLAIEQYKNSITLYSQAENLLLEELGLKDFKPKYEKTYIANLSDAFTAHRIDAEYFQPAYEEVIEKIKNYKNGFVPLLKPVENVKPDFDPTKYPDKIFSYVELADIDSSIGVIHSVNEIKGEEAPSRARRLLKEGDVIVSSVEGSLEKVALVDKEHDGCLASTGFFQFRPLDILPEVLLVLSKTIILQSQLKKRCSGTILTAVPKESLKDIIIPIFPLSIQQKIASLVQQSHKARRKAKELLEIAKRAVEIAIEESEEKAQEYIQKKVKS